MTKYDEQFKLKAVRDYLAGRLGYREVVRRYGIEHSLLRRWVSSYEQHGSAGLAKKFSYYDAAFKQGRLERMNVMACQIAGCSALNRPGFCGGSYS